MTEKVAIKKSTKPAVRIKKASSEKAEEKKYYESIGRRKTAIARVRFSPQGDGSISVNNKTLDQYFLDFNLQGIIKDILSKAELPAKISISAVVKGGGIHAQAEAIRHGIARDLVLFDAEFKKKLKKTGFLTRDPRMKERKKFGLKRARRAPQWSKR